MSLPVVVPVVEGHGESTAVPVLLRRIAWELSWPHEVAPPFRVPRSDLVDPVKLSRALRQHDAVRSDAAWVDDPEKRRGAKEQLSKLMMTPYREVRHQPAFSSLIDLETTWRNSRSFRRLLSALRQLLEVEPPPWTR